MNDKNNMIKLSILDYLRDMIEGTLTPQMSTHMRYPTLFP